MSGRNLHKARRLVVGIVPIEVIHLQLNEIHLGVSGQQLFQTIGIIVH